MNPHPSQTALDSDPSRCRNLALRVPSMDCPSCVVPVRTALLAEPGVRTVSADPALRSLTIAFDPTLVQPDALQQTLGRIGYPPDADAAGAPSDAPERSLWLPWLLLLAVVPILYLARDAVPFMGGVNGAFSVDSLGLDDFDSASVLAVGLAFVIGAVVVFSPGMLAMGSALSGLAASAPGRHRGRVRVAVGFVAGLILVDIVIGAVFGLGGKAAIRFFGENLTTWNLLIAAVLLASGLVVLGMWRLPSLAGRVPSQAAAGTGWAAAAGASFALIDCPACTPLLLPVALGAAATGSPWYGAAVMGAYGLGRGVLLLTLVASGDGVLRWGRLLPEFGRTRMVGGLLMLIVGLYFLKEFFRLATTLGL